MTDVETTVLIPTLWRPHQIAPLLESLYAHAGPIPVRPVFLCDAEDVETRAEADRSGADFISFPRVDGKPATMVAKCNAAFGVVSTPFFFGASDDIRFTPGCLERCHEELADPDKHVVCVSDGIEAHTHEGELTGHCLVRTSYIREQSGVLDEPGVIMHPGYVHYYSDVELWQVAKLRGCYVSRFDAKIEHRHPNDGTAGVDRVHQLGRSAMGHDRAVFESRRHQWEHARV